MNQAKQFDIRPPARKESLFQNKVVEVKCEIYETQVPASAAAMQPSHNMT